MFCKSHKILVMDSPIQNFFSVTPFGIYCLYCSPGTCLISKNTQDLVDHFVKCHGVNIFVSDDSYDVLLLEKDTLNSVMSENPGIVMNYVLCDFIIMFECSECKRTFRELNSFVLHQTQSNVCETDKFHALKLFQTVCGRLVKINKKKNEFWLFSDRSGKRKSENRFVRYGFHSKIRHLKDAKKIANKNFHKVSDVF